MLKIFPLAAFLALTAPGAASAELGPAPAEAEHRFQAASAPSGSALEPGAEASARALVRSGSRKLGLARLRYSERCIFEAVAYKMRVQLADSIPLPRVRMASQTPLKEFQDAVEKQWGMRPNVVVNVYVVDRNTIYLLDDNAYYLKYGRALDDSLAHEFTHYLQARYLNDASLDESIAIDAQNWFREHYIHGKPPAEAPACEPRGDD